MEWIIMLSKELILGASDLPIEEVQVPEWAGVVYVKTLKGRERDAFEQSIIDAKKKGGTNLVNVRARLAVRVLTDDKGNRVFTDADADALGEKSGKALDRIFDVAQRLSGIGAKEVAELEKN
jgi:hypothetical protein